MNITHVRPRFGPPVVVTLDYANAKEVTSQLHGNTEYLFTCNDGEVRFYAPLECYEQIARLNPEAGSTISVRKVKKGTKVEFEAALVSDSAEPEPEPPRPMRYTNGSKAAFPPAKYAQGVPQSDSPLPATNGRGAVATCGDGHGKVNGNGNGNTSAIGDPTAKHLQQCFHIAIDVLKEAQQYGRGQDFSATFLGSDVKSLALSIYINDQEKKR